MIELEKYEDNDNMSMFFACKTHIYIYCVVIYVGSTHLF